MRGGECVRLDEIGWNTYIEERWRILGSPEQWIPARVSLTEKGWFVVWSERGEMEVSARGKLLRRATPVTGDWVAIDPDRRVIEKVLERSTHISRKRPGSDTREQVLCANLDALYVVCGLDCNINVRRLERYLALSHSGGVEPIVILNKADLVEDRSQVLARVQPVAAGAKVLFTSAETGEGVEQLRACCDRFATVALLGSSGAGKSALTNRLLKQDRQAIGAVRESDHRGRHTTTRRELIRIPGSCLLMDLPGIRELELWDGTGMDSSFADIEKLAVQCRFRDCRHQGEPGCAVKQAVVTGELAETRMRSYDKLQGEVSDLERRQGDRMEAEENSRLKQVHKALRRTPKR